MGRFLHPNWSHFFKVQRCCSPKAVHFALSMFALSLSVVDFKWKISVSDVKFQWTMKLIPFEEIRKKERSFFFFLFSLYFLSFFLFHFDSPRRQWLTLKSTSNDLNSAPSGLLSKRKKESVFSPNKIKEFKSHQSHLHAIHEHKGSIHTICPLETSL